MRYSRLMVAGPAAVVLVLAPGAAAWADDSPTPSATSDSMAGMDHGDMHDMSGMDMDDMDMSGMDHDLSGTEETSATASPSASTSEHDSDHDMGSMDMDDMDHDMGGMTHGSDSDSSEPVSRPRALVLGGFAGVNGVGMIGALVLRRRDRAEKERKQALRRKRTEKPAQTSTIETEGTAR